MPTFSSRTRLLWHPDGGTRSRVREVAYELDLVLGEEADAVLAGGVQVAVEGVLDAVEREERHWRCDAYVDPEHPRLHILAPVADGGAVLGVDRAGVAEGRGVGELDGFFQAIHAHHREDGAEDLLPPDTHLPGHAVEESRAHEEAVFQGRLPAVERDRSALFFTEVDVGADLVAVGVADDGGELRSFLAAGADFHGSGGLLESLDQVVSDPANGHENAAGEAPLPGVAVGRAYDVGNGLLEDGVGHHDHRVLGAGQRLHPLAVGRAVRIDVLGHRLGPDEGDGLYARVFEDPIDGLPRPVDYADYPAGQAGLREQLSQLHRAQRRSLRRFQDVGVAGPYGDGNRPQGHHAGKVERGYGGDDPKGVAVREVVYPPRHVAHRIAHHQRGHHARELDHLYATPDFPGGVRRVLAVLQGDEVPELLEVFFQERLEAEEDTCPLDDRCGGPTGERFFYLLYGAVYVFLCREGRLGDHLSRSGVVDGFGVAPVLLFPPSPDKVPDLKLLLSRLHHILLTGPACRTLPGSCGRARRGRSSG